MRKLSLLLLFLLWIPAIAREKKPDPYQKIETQKQADGVLTMVTQDLRTMFGMNLSYPVELHLVDGKEMDAKFSDSPYKGAEIGLYTGIKGGRHQVYVMEGWSLDKCRGTTAHELTHAKKTSAGGRNRAAVYELALVAERQYRAGESLSYYITGDKATVTAYDHAKRLEDWNPDQADYNLKYYLKKLQATYKKFAPILSKPPLVSPIPFEQLPAATA